MLIVLLTHGPHPVPVLLLPVQDDPVLEQAHVLSHGRVSWLPVKYFPDDRVALRL